METPDLIDKLTGELKRERRVFSATFGAWSTASLLLVGAMLVVLPFRADLPGRSASAFFRTETLLFLALFFASTFVAFRSAVPSLLRSAEVRLGVGLLVLAVLGIVSRFSFGQLGAEWAGEMDFYRGRCGPIILILGGLDVALIALLARKTAPTRPWLTGAWIGLSAGSLGLFGMQFICSHENFLHLFIWHLVPVAALVAGGDVIGRRFLRW